MNVLPATAKRSASERFTAAMVLALCALMTVGVVVYLSLSRERLLDRTRSEASTLVETIAQHAERSIHEVDLSIRAAREAAEAGAEPARLHVMLADYQRSLPQVAQLVILGADGQIIADAPRDGTARLPGSIAAAFRTVAASRSDGLLLGAPIDNPVLGSWTMTVSRRTTGTDGSFDGAVIALVRFDYFSSFYRSLSFQGPTTILSLLDGETRLLVRYPSNAELLGRRLPSYRILDAAIEPGRRLEVRSLVMLDGGVRHAYVRQVGRFPLFVLVGVDEATLLLPWRTEAAAFASVLLVLVAVIGWLGWLGIRQMGRTRKSELAVARHAAWLDATIDAIDQGITVFDGGARLVAWNRHAETLLGIPEGRFKVGLHLADLMRDNRLRGEFGVSDVEVETLIGERLAAALGPDGEVYDHRRPNGRIVEIRRTPMPSGGFVTSYRDVTSERQVSRVLQRRAEILRILHSIAQAANEAPDLAGAMRRTLQLIAEGAGWPVAVAYRLVPGDEPTLAPAHWHLADHDRFDAFRIAASELRLTAGQGIAGAVLESGEPLTIADLTDDTRSRGNSLAVTAGLRAAFAVPVLERRRVVGVLAFFSDQHYAGDYFLFDVLDTISAQISRVADRERSEATLRARELRLRSVFESVDEGLLTIDEDGRIESLNPAAETMFGIRAEDAPGCDIRRLIADGEARFAGAGVIDRLIRSSSEGSMTDLEGCRTDGSRFPIELTARDMQLDDRRLAVVVVRDISERRRIDRLKNEFVSTVSHELRTPLTSISGALGLLAGNVAGELPVRARSLVEIARNNSIRLVALINDILDLEKIEAGRMEFRIDEADLVDLARQAIDANRAYAEKHQVEYRLIEPTTPSIVSVDPGRIMQVFDNLLSDAAKFSPAGGIVDVAVAHAGDARARVEVTDRGDGIPAAFRSRIFEKFSQADSTDSRAKGGTGLGLNIVKSIVERSGGTVGFDTAEGQGTTFWFEIPLAGHVDAGESTDDVVPLAGNLTSQALCLIGDDDASGPIVRVLSAEGFSVRRYATIDGVRRAIRGGRADVLVIDLEVAGHEGVDLIRELRSNEATRELPVIPVCTRRTGDDLTGGTAMIGDWLEVPVDERRLADALRLVFDGGTDPARILHVEDDPDIVEVVRVALRGVALIHAVPSLERARELLREQAFDVILLDLQLEDGSGADLIPTLSVGSEDAVPVILFSASEPPAQLIDRVADSLLKSKTSLDALRRSVGRIASRNRRRNVEAGELGSRET